MRIVYSGPPDQSFPVAVRIVGKHGLVTVVRVTRQGQAFFRRRMESKGRLRALEEGWPEEWHDKAKNISQSRRVFLDEIDDEDTRGTYCAKGGHQVGPLPLAELRSMVGRFKAGEPTFTLGV